jgi:hypothetical protein
MKVHHDVVGKSRAFMSKCLGHLGWLLLVASDENHASHFEAPGILLELIDPFHSSVWEGLVTGKRANSTAGYFGGGCRNWSGRPGLSELNYRSHAQQEQGSCNY